MIEGGGPNENEDEAKRKNFLNVNNEKGYPNKINNISNDPIITGEEEITERNK